MLCEVNNNNCSLDENVVQGKASSFAADIPSLRSAQLTLQR